MALVTRVSRLIRADIHALLDRMEEPEMLLRQAMREMEDVISTSRHQIEGGRRECEHLRRRAAATARALNEFSQQLDAAFASGNHAVARNVVRRQLETRALEQWIDERIGVLENELREAQQLLTTRQSELDALRQKAELFDDGIRTRDAHADDTVACAVVTDDDVDAALLQEMQRRELT